MDILEFVERASGNIAEADLIRDLSGRIARENKRRADAEQAAQKEAEDFFDSAQAEFNRAMAERLATERKVLLEKLQTRLRTHSQGKIDELKTKITGELSIVSTALENGLKMAP